MRYIKKSSATPCLANVPLDTDWDTFDQECKNQLTEDLHGEQSGICAYCERRLRGGDNRSVRIDHMVPRGLTDKQHDAISRHEELIINLGNHTYQYENMVLSCYGSPPPAKDHKKPDMSDVSCDQHKRDCFDIDRFLFPTTVTNVDEFFTWDSETGGIEPTDLNREKALYMIDLLNLDCKHLRIARRNALQAIVQVLLRRSQSESLVKESFDTLLSNYDFPSFINYAVSRNGGLT